MYNSSLIAFSYDRFLQPRGEGGGGKEKKGGEEKKGFRNKGHSDRGVFVERTICQRCVRETGKKWGGIFVNDRTGIS